MDQFSCISGLKKGKDTLAENNPTQYHGIGLFVPETGKSLKIEGIPSFYKKFLVKSLVDLAQENQKLLLLRCDAGRYRLTEHFRKNFPERSIDTGICEQHAVTYAAGLASQGLSTSSRHLLYISAKGAMTRLCMMSACKTFQLFLYRQSRSCGRRRSNPSWCFWCCIFKTCSKYAYSGAKRRRFVEALSQNQAFSLNEPCAVRYRGSGYGVIQKEIMRILPKGMGETMLPGRRRCHNSCWKQGASGIESGHAHKRRYWLAAEVFWSCLAEALASRTACKSQARTFKALLFVEEGVLSGGFSSSVLEFLSDNSLLDKGVLIKRLGLGDNFVEHGSQHELKITKNLGIGYLWRNFVSLFNKL